MVKSPVARKTGNIHLVLFLAPKFKQIQIYGVMLKAHRSSRAYHLDIPSSRVILFSSTLSSLINSSIRVSMMLRIVCVFFSLPAIPEWETSNQSLESCDDYPETSEDRHRRWCCVKISSCNGRAHLLRSSEQISSALTRRYSEHCPICAKQG